MRSLIGPLLAACAFLLVYATPAHAQTRAPVTQLSAEAARADIALMRRALETIHPGLYRYASRQEMDAAFDALAASIDGPIDDMALYPRIAAVLAMVRCTHTKAEQTPAMEAWRTSNPSHLPFRFRIIEGRMIVVSSDPDQAALARGAEVLAINGTPVAELIETLGAFVAIDGRTEWSRSVYLANDGDLMGADFDHYYPYVFGMPSVFSVVARDDDDAVARRVDLSAISFRDWLELPYDGAGYRANFSEATAWRMISDQVGYLSVPTFVNYRAPIDAAALYARALAELRGAGARALVIDLRQNGGGSNDAALALIDALASAPYRYQRAVRLRAVRYGDLPDFISTWGDREALFNPPMAWFTPTADGQFDLIPERAAAVLTQREPAANRFRGPVTVLIGPANASGATMTIARLADMNRVRLIGQPTGGSAEGPTAGTIFNVRLPNSGIAVRVPLAFNQMDISSFQPGLGVVPDLLVEETVADFREGRDRALEAALE